MKGEANSKALKWVHKELKEAEINKERAIKRHDDNAVADLENKIYILKYKSKKNEKKKIGHRQPYTKVQIESIVG